MLSWLWKIDASDGIFVSRNCPSSGYLSLGQEERIGIDLPIIIRRRKLQHNRSQVFETFEEEMVLFEEKKRESKTMDKKGEMGKQDSKSFRSG